MYIKNTNNNMKNFIDYLYESLNESEEETIQSEKEFREFARAKFEAAFGDELDEERMKRVIDGFLMDNQKLVDAEDWGELVGKFNQSFAPTENK